MTSPRESVLEAARSLFSERGYSGVSIRDIAALAGVSPAQVMKLGGSKADLFTATVTFEPTRLVSRDGVAAVPDGELGNALVRDILARREATQPDPVVRAVILLLPAPDAGVVRETFARAYTERIATRLGGDDEARTAAELIMTLLLGLAVSTRLLRMLDSGRISVDEVVARYAPLVQQIADDALSRRAGPPDPVR